VLLPAHVPCIHVDYCVSGCSALGSHGLLLVDGRVTAGEPWNVICLMGAMECYLFDGSCGMLFV
jgi:proteasome assembly chaperone (PAC2) family protein